MKNQKEKVDGQHTLLDDRRVLRLLARLSLPAMIGLLVNTLYTMVDMLFVGQAVGPTGLAALGISMGGYLILKATALMMGIGGGASLVSRQLGSGETTSAGRTAFVSVGGMLLISITLGVMGLLFFPHLAAMLGSDAETYPLVRSYLGVLLVGSPPLITLSTVLNALLRSQGKAKESMIASIIGNGCNILLDFLLIIVLDWGGVMGAAVATVVGQSSSALFAFYILSSRRSAFSIRKGGEGGDPFFQLLGRIASLGSPTLVRQLGTSVVTIVVNRSLLLYGDTLAIAAYGIIWSLLMFFNMPISGIVQGFQPIVGYHAGAKRNEEVSRVLKASFLVTFLIGCFFLLLVTLFPVTFLRLFTKDERLLERAVPAARLLLASLPLLGGIQSVGTAFFQAIGKALPALLLWVGRQFVLLIPLILLLGNYLGAKGIYLAFPIADFLSALFILYLVLRHLKQGAYGTS